jgi:hypothetical protein
MNRVALMLLLGMPASLAVTAATTSAPTFTKDVAPILYQHCVSCHRDGEIGAKLSLISYESAQSKAGAISDKVQARLMPPWPVDPAGSLKFRNDARLSDAEIATLVAWVKAGAPRGNDADLPPLPSLSGGWHDPAGRKPDAVVTLPAYTVRASVVVPYIQQLIKVPYRSDRWVSAIEVHAGNRAMLHHMGITEVELPTGMSPKDLEKFSQATTQMGVPNAALPNVRPVVTVPDGSGAYDMFGVYTPGTTLESYAPGSARLLKGGDNLYLNFNIHYTALASEQTDLSTLGLWFQPAAPASPLYRAPAAVKSILANGHELLTDDPGTKAEGTRVAIPPIPPNAANYELIGLQAYTVPVTFYQFQPHAHLRAKDFKYVVVYPDGREQVVLTVPHYAFDWQLAYDLDSPLHLPAGSKLIVTAHYDNSPANLQLKAHDASDPLHKCGPDKTAYFQNQNQSWDEMFSPLVQYSIDSDTHAPPMQEDAKPAPAVSGRSLPVVEAVGCLVSDAARHWMLRQAGSPLPVRSQATSQAEIAAATDRPSGTQSFALLGLGVFNPQDHAGQRVAVRGVLISGAPAPRLNVTSLQPLSGSCH